MEDFDFKLSIYMRECNCICNADKHWLFGASSAFCMFSYYLTSVLVRQTYNFTPILF